MTPGSRTITGSTTNPSSLTVKFTGMEIYTVTANYNLPGVGSYSARRSVYPTLPAPTIAKGPQLPGGGQEFHVTSPLPDSSYDLEWTDNGRLITTGYGLGLTSIEWYREDSEPVHAITCKIRLEGGEWSQLSSAVVMFY